MSAPKPTINMQTLLIMPARYQLGAVESSLLAYGAAFSGVGVSDLNMNGTRTLPTIEVLYGWHFWTATIAANPTI